MGCTHTRYPGTFIGTQHKSRVCRHSDFFRESAAYNYTLGGEREGDYEKNVWQREQAIKKRTKSHIYVLQHTLTFYSASA